MEITINKEVFKLKYTLRALFIFEQITKKTFQLKTLTDEYIFFYCLLIANNETQLTFEQLIEFLDEDPSIMNKYREFMEAELERQKQFQSDENNKDGEKKKH